MEETWTLDELQSGRYRMEETGKWNIFANISYAPNNKDPQDFRFNAARDASGTVTANKGRNMLIFGGVHYTPHKLGKHRSHRFSLIRSFDVCRPDKRWSLVGTDLQLPTFALQTVASQKLQLAFTCGGFFAVGRGPQYSLVYRGSICEFQLHHGKSPCFSANDGIFE
jgi:hypothetical protein